MACRPARGAPDQNRERNAESFLLGRSPSEEVRSSRPARIWQNGCAGRHRSLCRAEAMIDAFLAQLRELHVVDLIDIALVTTFIYSALVLVQRAQARMVAMGILFLGALYIAARSLDLRLMTWLLQGFFAVFLVIIVVIFQEELRRLFEQLALWGLRRRGTAPATYGPAEIAVSCVADFA